MQQGFSGLGSAIPGHSYQAGTYKSLKKCIWQRIENYNGNVNWRLLYLGLKTSALGMLRETLQKRGDTPAGVWARARKLPWFSVISSP